MKILLCGYHESGYRALRHLVAQGHEVAVVTHDSPLGLPSLVHYATALGLPCVSGSMTEVHTMVSEFRPEIIFSVYYRSIIPNKIIALAPRGAYNFHPSLLPKHRGCFSAPWAIMDGDTITGVTCHRMSESVDQGDSVATSQIPINNDDTGIRLFYKLIDTTVSLFATVMEQASKGELCGCPQIGKGSYHKRELPFGGMIDPAWSRERMDRFIRAMTFPPYAPAQFMMDGVSYPIHSVEHFDEVRRRVSKPNEVSSICVS